MTTTPRSSLSIRDLNLPVHLGWQASERAVAQIVVVEIDISFPIPPKACETDDLNDTFCYAALINELFAKTVTPHFRLVEHLSHALYTLLKPMLPEGSDVTLRLTKRPTIPDFTGAVCFTYADGT